MKDGRTDGVWCVVCVVCVVYGVWFVCVVCGVWCVVCVWGGVCLCGVSGVFVWCLDCQKGLERSVLNPKRLRLGRSRFQTVRSGPQNDENGPFSTQKGLDWPFYA